MSTKYEEYKVRRKELEETMKTEAKAAFAELTKHLFEEDPILESFSWRQYTPYFNDGNTCEFGALTDSDSIEINGLDSYNDKNYKKPEEKARFKKVSSLLKTFEEDDLKSMFGDHQQITVKRDGSVEVEDYEHD